MRTAILMLLLAGCASSPASEDPPAPWTKPPLTDVPAIYRTVWQKAENRSTCALLAPASLGDYPNATPRSATFSGGWAVAYDLPNLRSAFGVAGAGVSARGDVYSGWPHKKTWSDGSSAGYGPEGGTGPKELAYVTIAGQDCLYNVWSNMGLEHLEELIGQLRFVATP